jgi:hypothetical protein
MERLPTRIAALRRTLLASAGHFAAVLALAGCASASHVGGAAEQARQEFSRENFCPLVRVTAAYQTSTPPPPPEIENDPERRAMWEAAARQREATKEYSVVDVNGCGVHVDYACWDYDGSDRGPRGQRLRWHIGIACIEEAP